MKTSMKWPKIFTRTEEGLYPTLLRAAQLADIHVINEAKLRVEGRWSFSWKIIFTRTRGKRLPPPSHSSPVSEVSRRRKKFWMDPGCSSSPYNCKQMWLLINWSKESGYCEENAEIKPAFPQYKLRWSRRNRSEAGTKSAWRQDTTVFPAYWMLIG